MLYLNDTIRKILCIEPLRHGSWWVQFNLISLIGCSTPFQDYFAIPWQSVISITGGGRWIAPRETSTMRKKKMICSWIRGARSANRSRALEMIPCFYWGSCCRKFSCICNVLLTCLFYCCLWPIKQDELLIYIHTVIGV